MDYTELVLVLVQYDTVRCDSFDSKSYGDLPSRPKRICSVEQFGLMVRSERIISTVNHRAMLIMMNMMNMMNSNNTHEKNNK